MRTRLEGTQASGAGESHTQDANVAEVSYGKPVMGESEYPDKARTTRRRAIRGHGPSNAPDKQVTNGVVGSTPRRVRDAPVWTTTLIQSFERAESQRLLIAENMLPGPVRRSQG